MQWWFQTVRTMDDVSFSAGLMGRNFFPTTFCWSTITISSFWIIFGNSIKYTGNNHFRRKEIAPLKCIPILTKLSYKATCTLKKTTCSHTHTHTHIYIYIIIWFLQDFIWVLVNKIASFFVHFFFFKKNYTTPLNKALFQPLGIVYTNPCSSIHLEPNVFPMLSSCYCTSYSNML